MRKAHQLALSTVFAGIVVACGSEEGLSAEPRSAESGAPGEFGGRCLPSDAQHVDLTTQSGYAPVGYESSDSGCVKFGGHALVVGGSVNVLLAKVALGLVSTGELPEKGGYLNADLLELDAVGGGIVGVTASAFTAGYDRVAASEAEIQGLHIGLGVIDLDADVVKSRSEAKCGSRSGESVIANLRINGVTVDIAGEPNEHLVRGLVNVVINEQIASATGMRTNALHISVLGLADIILAQSEASLTCSCEDSSDPPYEQEWKRTHDWSGAAASGGLGAKCDASNVCAPGLLCTGAAAPLVK